MSPSQLIFLLVYFYSPQSCQKIVWLVNYFYKTHCMFLLYTVSKNIGYLLVQLFYIIMFLTKFLLDGFSYAT